MQRSEEINGGAVLAKVESDAFESDGLWTTLSAAVEGGAIKRLGELQVLDEDMCVSNDTSWDKASVSSLSLYKSDEGVPHHWLQCAAGIEGVSNHFVKKGHWCWRPP